MLLCLADLPRRLRKILLLDIFPAGGRKVSGGFLRVRGRKEEHVPVISDSEHPRFRHDVTQIGPIESVRELTTIARQC
jgi:hypothetical protein